MTTAGAGDIYLAKLSSAGAHVWSKCIISGQTGLDGVKAIATDSQGNVVLTGGIISALSFGGAALTNPFVSGTVDTFVAKFSSTGAHVWSKRYGGYYDDLGATITTDRSDNVFVFGQFYGSMQFGAAEQINSGGYDGYIAKFAP